MTQSVRFHFASPQFVFEAGRVMFSKGARFSTSPDKSVGEIVNGVLDDVLVEGPIEFDATLTDLTLIRRRDGLACGVPVFWASGKLEADALRSGHVFVDLDLPLMLVFRVDTASAERVSGARLSIIQPSMEATLEITANEEGELKVLARPGLYSVMATTGEHTGDRANATFEVAPGEHGERLIVLQTN
jgi:hypothetical protein